MHAVTVRGLAQKKEVERPALNLQESSADGSAAPATKAIQPQQPRRPQAQEL